MIRFYITFMILISVLSVFPQSKYIKQAEKSIEKGKYEEAKGLIENAFKSPETSTNGKAWFVKGQVYYFLANESSYPDNLVNTSYESFSKAMELGYGKSEVAHYLEYFGSITYNKGVKLYEKGSYGKAMEQFYRSYLYNQEAGKADLQSLDYAAMCATLADDQKNAAKFYAMLYDLNYESEDLYSKGPPAVAKAGNRQKALDMIKSGRTKYPDSYTVLIGEINVYLALGEPEHLIPLMRKAIEKDPENYSLYFALGTIFQDMDGYLYEAENAYKKAIEIKPESFDPYYNLGVLYVNTVAKMQEEANDLPLSEQDRYDELTRQANKNMEFALPYLEKAFQIDQSDQALNNALKEIYVRLKIQDKLKVFNEGKLLSYLLKEPINSSPEIFITSPSISRGFKILDPYKSSEPSITIAGQAVDKDGINYITINGQSVPFDKDGYFSESVNLKEGFNAIHIVATDMKSKEAQKDLYFERTEVHKEVAASSNSREGVTYHALIIGVNEYIDPGVKDLENPINDAQKLYDLLIKYYTFDPENISFLKDPGRDEIYNIFETYMEKIDEDDNLLIFYAGHGHWDEELKRGYWLPSNAQQGRRSTWFSNNDLTDYIRGMKCRHTLLISDACFSGSIFKTRGAFDVAPKDIRILSEMPSRTAMTSGTLTEVPDKSVFIEYLAKRLEQNTEKYLTTEGLFNSFRRAVISNSVTDQVPQYGSIHLTGDEGGEFIFIRKN
nr:caspase family protein [Bacteroidota bacterium]